MPNGIKTIVETLNEVIDHLNTQEEKEKQVSSLIDHCRNVIRVNEDALKRKEECPERFERVSRKLLKGSTASNQPNTETKQERIRRDFEIHGEECPECDGTQDFECLGCGRGPDTELPKKIKLLREFAGYPAGDEFFMYEDSYRAIDDGKYNPIHPDIIKATSGQGIRSEVTDGEERLDRSIGYDVKYHYEDYINHEHVTGKTLEKEITKGAKITPDPYEECAKEIDDYCMNSMNFELRGVVAILKKYLQPKA